MNSYERRVQRLEASAQAACPASRICTIYDEGEGDPEAQVAAWRAANDWPDDSAHPLQVVRVVYVDAELL